MRYPKTKMKQALAILALFFSVSLATAPVLAANASMVSSSESAPAKKSNGGSSVAIWVAVGVAIFFAVQSARGRKPDADKDTK